MNQSCNYMSVIPSFRRISLYSYNLSLWGVGRGLEVVAPPRGDLLLLESHLFSLKPLFVTDAYIFYLPKQQNSYDFFMCTFYAFSIHKVIVHLTLHTHTCRSRDTCGFFSVFNISQETLHIN